MHQLLALADLALATRSVEHVSGNVAVRGFVLSMPTLFERLIGRLLAEVRGNWRVVEQRVMSLDIGHRLTIRPDLTVLRGRQVIAVADLKYKLLDNSGRFAIADAYQLIAYCGRLGSRPVT